VQVFPASPTLTSDDVAGIVVARSERQALDWALVLASQGIEAVIEPAPPNGAWTLRVPAAELGKAQEAIRLFRKENRRFAWRRELPSAGVVFHHGTVLWAMALILVHVFRDSLLTAGRFDSEAVRSGAWWRAFTATSLHSDVAHLAANTMTGGVAMGFAMGRFGPGTTLALTLAAGAAGNAFAMATRGTPYLGLGASGAVMGAVGLLTGHAVTWWQVSRHASRRVLGGLAAGSALFLVVGVDPAADVLAHLGGFLCGTLLGALASWWRWERHDRAWMTFFVATTLATWTLAKAFAIPHR
jgi:membrane associated rhomboid family serine protease